MTNLWGARPRRSPVRQQRAPEWSRRSPWETYDTWLYVPDDAWRIQRALHRHHPAHRLPVVYDESQLQFGGAVARTLDV